jgi:predicted amidophosphoribosyltransferase
MRDEKQAVEKLNQAEQEATLLKRHEAFHQFIQECRECQQATEFHWQFCAHCGIRLATQCPGCGNPLPPAGAHACPSCGLAIPQLGS